MGITVNVQTPTPETVEAQRQAGEYDMLFVVHGGSCSMYDNYFYHLDSTSPPASNYIFHKNPEVDELIGQLRTKVDVEEQKEAVGELASTPTSSSRRCRCGTARTGSSTPPGEPRVGRTRKTRTPSRATCT